MACFLFTLSARPAWAADGTWITNGDGNWNGNGATADDVNWSGGTKPSGADATVFFKTTMTTDITVTLIGANRSVGNFWFEGFQ